MDGQVKLYTVSGLGTGASLAVIRLDELLDPTARVLGFIFSAILAGDESTAILYTSIGGLYIPLWSDSLSYNGSGLGAVDSIKISWLGVDRNAGVFENWVNEASNPTLNTLYGSWPMGMPVSLTNELHSGGGLVAAPISLQIDNTQAGTCTIIYQEGQAAGNLGTA